MNHWPKLCTPQPRLVFTPFGTNSSPILNTFLYHLEGKGSLPGFETVVCHIQICLWPMISMAWLLVPPAHTVQCWYSPVEYYKIKWKCISSSLFLCLNLTGILSFYNLINSLSLQAFQDCIFSLIIICNLPFPCRGISPYYLRGFWPTITPRGR